MTTYRVPCLIRAGGAVVTGVLVESDDNITAVGKDAKDVLRQLTEYLRWRARESADFDHDFLEPELEYFKVPVRPEYRLEKKVWACNQQQVLEVACVSGKHENGQVLAAIPFLGIRFYFNEKRELPTLIEQFVREVLKGFSPQQLSPMLSAADFSLETIPVRVDEDQDDDFRKTPLPELTRAGEPIGERRFRSRFPHIWSREEQLDALVGRLEKEKANLALLGPAGVGKTSILAHAVRRIEKDLSVEERREYPSRYWSVRPGNLIAGLKYLGEWQQRCEAIIEELEEFDGVLYIDNISDFMRLGGEGIDDGLAAFFKPYLQRGEVRLLIEARPEEWEACARLFPAFAALFQVMHIPAIGRNAAMDVLGKVAEVMHQRYRLRAEEGVTALVGSLFRRFMPYHPFPGETVRFLERCFETAASGKQGNLSRDHVIVSFVERTGLPEFLIRDSLPLAWETVLKTLQERLLGQEPATKAVADVVTTFKAGLNDSARPLGVLLFCGPTGVGKTELAKTLASYLFGHGVDPKSRLIRLDMSEYNTYGAAERLLGDPRGDPADWVQKIRSQPFAVVLLDEIEKAAPEVFDILLNVLDEGRLTDAYGRETNFRGAIIIMTSNLGSGQSPLLGFGKGQSPAFLTAVKKFFRPELINRIDHILAFDALSKDQVRTIAERELASLAQREGLEKANIRLQWQTEVVDLLVREGFDPRYGARPLQRFLEQKIVTALARHLLNNSGLRDVTLHLDLDEDHRILVR